MGMESMAGMAEGMQGLAGMEEMGKAMAGMGMENMAKSLASAFENPEVGITTAMSGTVGMISGAISGKAAKEKSAVAQGTEMKGSFAAGMAKSGPEALEMPKNISESGMMMGAMIMAKPSLAGGLPGAMAPPEGMTAMGLASGEVGAGMSGVMEGMGATGMGQAMAGMTGMDI